MITPLSINPYEYYYPVSYLPSVYNSEPITLNPDYVDNLIALNVTDYFSPTQFATNPLFANVDSFNQNVGLLQTTVNSLDKILTLADTYKDLTPLSDDLLQDFATQVNDILNNTTYDNLNVFDQTIKLNDQDVNLSVPVFNPDTQTIEEYTKLLQNKYDSLYKTLQNLSFTLPTQTNFNPYEASIPTTTLSAFDLNSITPQTLELLLAS